MKKLFVAWHDQQEKKWYPVGLLTKTSDMYHFCYTRGAKHASNFTPFGVMSKLSSSYSSSELFPLFANRLLRNNRPEFSEFIEWLGLNGTNYDPLDVLALTEGKRGTDTIEIFPCPYKDSFGNYTISFFSHGLRYVEDGYITALSYKKTGDPLYLVPDPQNRYDPKAILLRTDDPVMFAGYCPRYLTKDFHQLLSTIDPQQIIVRVSKVNTNAPLQFRLMCKVTTPWPEDFIPCSDPLFEPLADLPTPSL
ncbi:HIRAN domain-containing protein [Humidesulfovibrio sp.]